MENTVTAALGLGGNVGNPPASMAHALRTLDERDDTRAAAVSRLFRTPPWGKTDQAWFYNACAVVETRLRPAALLDVCLGLERAMKRVRAERWGPRTLDIDILTHGNFTGEEPGLTLPHPRMTERGFVMMPLADIAPDLEIEGKSVRAWVNAVDTRGIEVVSDERDWWRTAG